MRCVVPDEIIKMSRELRELMSIYREAEDLIRIGAYRAGANKSIDRAISLEPIIKQFLMQEVQDRSDLNQTFGWMNEILQQA